MTFFFNSVSQQLVCVCVCLFADVRKREERVPVRLMSKCSKCQTYELSTSCQTDRNHITEICR